MTVAVTVGGVKGARRKTAGDGYQAEYIKRDGSGAVGTEYWPLATGQVVSQHYWAGIGLQHVSSGAAAHSQSTTDFGCDSVPLQWSQYHYSSACQFP